MQTFQEWGPLIKVLYTPHTKLSAYNPVTFLLATAGPTEQLHGQNPDNFLTFFKSNFKNDIFITIGGLLIKKYNFLFKKSFFY